MLKKEELLSLINAYNEGEFSFGEVFLASGLDVKGFIAFMKEHGLVIVPNFDFIERGRGLNEDALERVLEMNKNE